MSIACEFEYLKPTSWKAALEALGKEGAWALAGGSDLIAWLRDGAVQPAAVVDLKGLPGWSGIEKAGKDLRLAGGTTFA
ncbi:MAG: FAD binding domain-containing protein, partial [Kiritimatiellae bacterium]|nr:FAD binding domain-containing protein [Kiritimatiellia bacterium]